MPKTAKEIVDLKLNKLRRNVQHAQNCVSELDAKVKSLPVNLSSLNMVLDNLLLSSKEFVSNFDEANTVCQDGSTPSKTFDVGSSSGDALSLAVSEQDPTRLGDNSDLLTRMEKLETALDDVRNTIHGGGDGASSHRGILPHLSHLENSFNEGKQSILALEDKMETVTGLVEDRMKTISGTVDERMQNINLSLMERIKNVDVSVRDKIINVDVSTTEQIKEIDRAMTERIHKVNESLVDQTHVQKMDAKLVSFIDEVRTKSEKDDHNKDLENEMTRKRLEELENKCTDNVACKLRLTVVEEELKGLKPGSDDAKSPSGALVPASQLGGIKLEMDSLKTQLLDRISFLEKQRVVAFVAEVHHEGPWTGGAVIRKVKSVHCNYGNAFEVDQCRFIVPVTGIYCLILWVHSQDGGDCEVQVSNYDLRGNKWLADGHCSVTVAGGTYGSDVALVNLEKGQALRLRVYEGGKFSSCHFSGWLVSPREATQ